MKIVVAITAASGAIYARQLLETLVKSEQVEHIALIYSSNARAVVAHEGEQMPCSEKIEEYDNCNLFASPASGSARWDAMVVVPSSVGTIGRVASGVSQTLIERAADVMLKERRRLIFVVRETPYSLIHLRNMTTLTEAGAVILPATPSFYSLPQNIEAVCQTVTERITAILGLNCERYEWGK
ncbi:MAG: UbiX family flavin prenyltransferase [Bacteroidaceae bacterium]|nr:UbiX family flavin prenyltransferase [Alistipes sp.]MBQ8450386.1 UbiX family flavin prenyltransferase [Bacteroidaceae bacterium]